MIWNMQTWHQLVICSRCLVRQIEKHAGQNLFLLGGEKEAMNWMNGDFSCIKSLLVSIIHCCRVLSEHAIGRIAVTANNFFRSNHLLFVLFTLHNVYIALCLHSIMFTLLYVYKALRLHCIVFTLHYVYIALRLHCIMFTLLYVYKA